MSTAPPSSSLHCSNRLPMRCPSSSPTIDIHDVLYAKTAPTEFTSVQVVVLLVIAGCSTRCSHNPTSDYSHLGRENDGSTGAKVLTTSFWAASLFCPNPGEYRQTMAHVEGFEPPTPSSEVWYRVLSLTFTWARSCSLPLHQADHSGPPDAGEQARLPATIEHCGQTGMLTSRISLPVPRRREWADRTPADRAPT